MSNHSKIPHLPKKVRSKISNSHLAELYLGKRKKKKFLTQSWQRSLLAIAIWILSGILFEISDIDDAYTSIQGLSTLGLVVIFFSSWLHSYKGPVWPIIGSPMRRITKSTPEPILIFFGWFLILFVLFLSIMANVVS